MIAVARSSLATTLTRYSRSAGLWVMLLVAPIGARFMVAARGATGSTVSVGDRVPWLTSQVLGMTLGVVIATLALPAAFIYLRANVTRRQAWQVEEPSPGSRIAIAYGRWAADVAVLSAILAATTAAGILLAVILLPLNEVNPAEIVLTLWAIAGPPMVMVASVRALLDARPWTRGPLGEVLYFAFWMGSIVMAMAGQHKTGLAANIWDLDGFMSPISYGQAGTQNFTIGGAVIPHGSAPIILNVMAGVFAPGYLPARAIWLAIAAAAPLIAGLIYASHVARKTRRTPAWLRFLQPGPARPADPAAPDARPAALPWLNLLGAEVRLMAGGRLTLVAMAAIAMAGAILPYSRAIGPAAMLLLVFIATAHAGRSEQTGLLALTRTGAQSPWARRIAFVVAGALLMLAMSGPAIARALTAASTRPLLEALVVGAATATAAITLGAVSRSATAPRLVLLIAWYGYLNAGGA